MLLELMMVEVEVVNLLFLGEGVEDLVSLQGVVSVDLLVEELVVVLNLSLTGVVAMAWSCQMPMACLTVVGVAVGQTLEPYLHLVD